MIPSNLIELAKSSNITEINFSNLKTEHLSVDAISAIMACIQLHQANVSKLIFENSELDSKRAQLFKIVLSDGDKNIIYCNFENNQLGDKGLDHILQAIKNNPIGDMRVLKISRNDLSIQAAIRLSHVLKKRHVDLPPLNLQILKMNHNNIGNIGTETLASFIKKNSTLKYLDISFNDIGDRGLLAIAECLRENETIEVLNLLGNSFTDKALTTLG